MVIHYGPLLILLCEVTHVFHGFRWAKVLALARAGDTGGAAKCLRQPRVTAGCVTGRC